VKGARLTGTFFTFYAVYAISACALLVCSTLQYEWSGSTSNRRSQGKLDYVAVPSRLLYEWSVTYPNLLIFNLRSEGETNTPHEDIPVWLPVSKEDLPNLLKWLPIESRVAFCCEHSTKYFEPQVEATFLELGIEVIYLLDEHGH